MPWKVGGNGGTRGKGGVDRDMHANSHLHCVNWLVQIYGLEAIKPICVYESLLASKIGKILI